MKQCHSCETHSSVFPGAGQPVGAGARPKRSRPGRAQNARPCPGPFLFACASEHGTERANRGWWTQVSLQKQEEEPSGKNVAEAYLPSRRKKGRYHPNWRDSWKLIISAKYFGGILFLVNRMLVVLRRDVEVPSPVSYLVPKALNVL